MEKSQYRLRKMMCPSYLDCHTRQMGFELMFSWPPSTEEIDSMYATSSCNSRTCCCLVGKCPQSTSTVLDNCALFVASHSVHKGRYAADMKDGLLIFGVHREPPQCSGCISHNS